MEYRWELSSTAIATLTVSREIDADDVGALQEYLDTTIKRLRKHADRRASQAKPEEPANGLDAET